MASGWIGSLALVAGTGAGLIQGGDDAAGERGRAEFGALVKRSFEGQKAQKTGSLQDRERVFGLALCVIEGGGLRVLAAEGEEAEARRVASAMTAVRGVFVGLTGMTDSNYPQGLSAYLLGTSEAKAAFLEKHPLLGPELRARFAKLEGAGVDNTADWAWWEGDAEKRLDGMVRLSVDWLTRTVKVTVRHAWLHEGLGFYLTHALVGTYLTWFERPSPGNANPMNVALRSQMDEPGADWLPLARGLFAAEQDFDLEELLHLELNELEPIDHLRAHALAGYLVEVHRAVLGPLLERVGKGDDPRGVLEELLGTPLGELRTRLDGWLERREALVAKAEGRRSEAELRAQWQGLNGARRRAAVAAFARRLEELDTQQMRWLRALLAGVPAEPPLAEAAPYFDPKVHAPAQIIVRRRLPESDPKVKRLLAEVRKEPDRRAPVLAFDYDWVRAQIVRSADPDEPEAVFHNALLGLPPRADLARAQVLATLDRADERKLQAAFAHAYTDRDGIVYPLTLFEMLSTGIMIERPDVDVLGIVHDVLDEWRRWVAPVPATQHDVLYKAINDLFSTCKSSRELRLSLAELFLAPGMTPRVGFETLTLNLQTLWASVENDPQKLAALLPDGKGRDPFLAELVGRCQKDYKFYATGRRRAAQLRRDGEALRIVLAAALDEAAAIEISVPGGAVPAGGR